ncbi:colanic acid biosynthesis fucosyltransferase WcaI [Colwellia sp. KU-HH00111]|uniref:WcaI family glycosyltransferase n=1 Tax=Colwellia sp. KU-HH00111 TaxID=3127652 RepID=UPI0031088E0E
MKFLLYSLNYSPELTGIGKYNGEMISALSEMGVEAHVLTAQPYYPEWKIHKNFKNKWTKSLDENTTVYRCPLYVPNKISFLKRILHLVSFSLSSAMRLCTLFKLKPDVLFIVQPTLFCVPAALLYCKIIGAKSIMHIQDYELDAMFGLGLLGEKNAQKGFLASFAKKIESWLMAKFDAISTISYSMIDIAKEKGVAEEKLIFFPNWSDTQFVTPNTCGNTLKKDWGFEDSDKIVLYAGNIGKKQGLEIVLTAAKQYMANTRIKFVLVGDGVHLASLQNLARQLQLDNLYFKPLLPWSRVPEMLALADVHLVIQNKGVADAVLPSKLTNILSAGGHALVAAEQNTELGKLAVKHVGIYTLIEPEDISALKIALDKLLSMDTTIHNSIARKFAEQHLGKDKILSKFYEDLKQLVNK